MGTVCLEVQQHDLSRHRATVMGLVVSEAYTRRGTARRLIQVCREEAARLGCTILEISCRAGEPPEFIYPRLGFMEYGRLPRGLKESWGDGREFMRSYSTGLSIASEVLQQRRRSVWD